MEAPHLILNVPIEDKELLRALKLPQARNWIEASLSSGSFEPFVAIVARRFGKQELGTLFPPSPGALLVFKLGLDPDYSQLPPWLRDAIPVRRRGKDLRQAMANVVAGKLSEWADLRPWLQDTGQRHERAREALESIGDWSFRLSKNDNFYAYPATFVHAIPASLINALGVKGELIVDPFGGTGQTAIETVKYAGIAVTGDANTVATLVAQARLTYLKCTAEDLPQERKRRSATGYCRNRPSKLPVARSVVSSGHISRASASPRLHRAVRRPKTASIHDCLLLWDLELVHCTKG
jgi:hypothetical protein